MDLYAIIILAIAALVLLTNIIVQVAKKATWDKLPTNALALIVAMVLTVATGIAVLQVKGITIVWWMILALVVVGFIVAYAAMFGFDKLMEAIAQWRKIKTEVEG